MKRYCETKIAKLVSCDVGWGAMDSGGIKSCYDLPIEENCHHLLDEDEEPEPFFFSHIKEAYSVITSKDRERMKKAYPPPKCVCRHCGQTINPNTISPSLEGE